MKDLIGLLLRIFIPIIGLILVFLPLWYVGWKVQRKTWWHYVGSVVGMGVVLVLIDLAVGRADRIVYHNVYNSGVIQDGISDGTIFLAFTSIATIALSPFIFVKKKYLKFNAMNTSISVLSSAFLIIIQLVIYAYLIAAGLGQAGAKYF